MTEPSFTEEDREVLAALADNYDAVPNMHDGRLIARAAAYIEELEARVEATEAEAADEQTRAVRAEAYIEKLEAEIGRRADERSDDDDVR